MNKRKILISAIAVCLVAILAFGSLAVFTDSRSVTNKFMTASSVDPEKEIFGIALFETDITKTDGSKTEIGNTYTEILPGKTLTKDPTVENTGIHPQFVRVLVTVDNASAWKAACVKHGITDLNTIFSGFNSDWQRKGESEDTTADTITYVYYLNKVLEPEETSTLFTAVTIPQAFDIADMTALKEFNLTLEAQAIQSEEIGCTNAYDAFTGFWK